MTRAYSDRIGLLADSPNFPAAWDQVVEKVKIADELGYDFDPGWANPGVTNSLLLWPILCVPPNASRLGLA